MHLNDPWKELYKNWPARNDREAQALTDGFLFAVPYLYEPYILITGELNPIKIEMNDK